MTFSSQMICKLLKYPNIGKIWLIGGTRDSADLAAAIANAQIPCIATVTTNSAKSLYPDNFSVRIGCLSLKQMEQFCAQENIVAIVDASHPFATGVSQNAIASAQLRNIPYLRYERNPYHLSEVHRTMRCKRPRVLKDTASHIGERRLPRFGSLGKGTRTSRRVISEQLSVEHLTLDSFETLLNGDYLQGHRVLLTVGCKILPQFKRWQDRATLFARVLPKVNSLQIALDSGFKCDRIIAMRPPISIELETALWQQWQISLVVTKASGKAGGENIKHQVADSLGIPLITIARPKIFYPEQTSCIKKVMAFCRQYNSHKLTK